MCGGIDDDVSLLFVSVMRSIVDNNSALFGGRRARETLCRGATKDEPILSTVPKCRLSTSGLCEILDSNFPFSKLLLRHVNSTVPTARATIRLFRTHLGQQHGRGRILPTQQATVPSIPCRMRWKTSSRTTFEFFFPLEGTVGLKLHA